MSETAGAEGLSMMDQADATAGALFDELILLALRGHDLKVAVTWSEEGSVDQDGGLQLTPYATISGRTAQNYMRGVMESTGSSPELIRAAGESFNILMACTWQDTLDELEVLDVEISALATQASAPYWDRAKEELRKHGIEGIGDGEMVAIARQKAIEDLGVWAAAVEANADPEEPEEIEPYSGY